MQKESVSKASISTCTYMYVHIFFDLVAAEVRALCN